MNKAPEDKNLDMKTLLMYARGDEATIKEWSGYIENDADLVAKAEALKNLVGLFDGIDDALNTPAATRLANAIFNGFSRASKSPSENNALMYYDSALVPLPAGVRPSLVSERRLKYSTVCGNLELSILPVFPGRHEITGRFEPSGAQISGAISLAGKLKKNTVIDDLGFFVFSGIPAGSYRIDFICNGEKACVKDLNIE